MADYRNNRRKKVCLICSGKIKELLQEKLRKLEQ